MLENDCISYTWLTTVPKLRALIAQLPFPHLHGLWEFVSYFSIDFLKSDIKVCGAFSMFLGVFKCLWALLGVCGR